MVYTEDNTTKTNDGGLNSMRKERKIVWVYPSANVNRCLVRIIDKYVSLLPPMCKSRKPNFYLRSLDKYTPVQWYGEQMVGQNTLRKIMGEISEKGNLEGFFTNHSLCRSSTTRLFQAGVDRKLVKEFTGHRSDAVDAYQITSDQQRQSLSARIAGCDNVKRTESHQNCNLEVAVTHSNKDQIVGCSCIGQKINVNDIDQLGKLLNDLIMTCKGHKTTIKLDGEFSM